MTGFIRPEARAAIWRWREVIVGGVLAAIGLWWALQPLGPVLLSTAIVTIGLGAAIIFTGIQRLRFRLGGGGPGVVQVDEGRVTYFGPLDGGSIDVEEMALLALDHQSRPTVWILEQPGQPRLHIPVTAEGAEALFDAFLRLDGLETDRMLSSMQSKRREMLVIWRRGTSADLQIPLN